MHRKSLPFLISIPCVSGYILNPYSAEVATCVGLVFLPRDSTFIGITTSAQPSRLRKSLHKTFCMGSAQGIELTEVCNLKAPFSTASTNRKKPLQNRICEPCDSGYSALLDDNILQLGNRSASDFQDSCSQGSLFCHLRNLFAFLWVSLLPSFPPPVFRTNQESL